MPLIYQAITHTEGLKHYLSVSSDNELLLNAGAVIKFRSQQNDGIYDFRKETGALGALERISRVAQFVFAYLKSIVFVSSNRPKERT